MAGLALWGGVRSTSSPRLGVRSGSSRLGSVPAEPRVTSRGGDNGVRSGGEGTEIALLVFGRLVFPDDTEMTGAREARGRVEAAGLRCDRTWMWRGVLVQPDAGGRDLPASDKF